MIDYALKMLIGNKASFLGVIFGVFLATLLISQQSAIYLGLFARSYRMVTDISSPNIWVMDTHTESDEKVRNIPRGYLSAIRSIPDIEWASPIFMNNTLVTTPSKGLEIGRMYGVNDATLIGAPNKLISGNVHDLLRPDSVIVDVYSARGPLAKKLQDGTKVPLKVGDEMEINSKRAVVVGISDITQGFYPSPIIYSSTSEFLHFNPSMADSIAFIIVKTKKGANVKEVTDNIHTSTGLSALTRNNLKKKSSIFF